MSSRQSKVLSFLLVLSLTISGCTALGLTKPATLDAQILAADQAVTAVLTAADTALNAKLITKAQAQSVSAIAHQVDPLLDSARAASAAGNVTASTKTMTFVNQLLAGLKAYVPPPVKP